MTHEFSYENYGAILDEIATAGYEFQRLDRATEAPRRFFLRHDVDISPLAAQRLGAIEEQRGIASSFFFQIGCECYDVFSQGTLEIMRSLREKGHAVGLHIDEVLFGESEGTVARTIHWFRDCVQEIDPVVSFHRPTDGVVGKRYESFVNAYDPDLFDKETYASDSRRNQEFFAKLELLLSSGAPSIQWLTHPVWWHSGADMARILELLHERKRSELNAYLKSQFTKAFAGLIEEDEDGATRL